ncbi:Uncharacterized protein PECH_000516 [Penicillium ucsense]|uniref:FAD-dependent urate hydroxylase HpyO/Asp monooxygenase CreE-like FAD/NAD(P)-binding domain-containing protein n=1 Tax=Penicillium ucsense TaxID=2839758 RepID=A0A8J8WID5_9EURO|nr:Uncharacterized protein PECM_008923 [Penicillium ucsense]KAF7733479.1 Uncharacterized protein PECH_000516 [Penicillium ucsense]
MGDIGTQISAVNMVYGPQIAIVGAGPRGTSTLERIAASATQFIAKNSWLTIYIIDPYPPGAGRVWRTDQSGLLLMNTVSSQVTLFTDDKVHCDGPKVQGPTLFAMQKNGHTVGPDEFSTRIQCGTYLRWVYDHVVERLPSNVKVKLHTDHAKKATKMQNGLYQLSLTTGVIENLSAVILAQGHLPRKFEAEETEDEEFASKHGNLTYIPPCNPADAEANLSKLKAGQSVVLKGLGLSFFDYITLLSEGRGGEYVREDCKLIYKASGREPAIYCYSRRGLPMHARGQNQRAAADRQRPILLTDKKIEGFRKDAAQGNPPIFEKTVLSIIQAEVEYDWIASCTSDDKKSTLLGKLNIGQNDRWNWGTVKNPHKPDKSSHSLKSWQEWLKAYLNEDIREALLGNVDEPHAAARSVLRDLRNDIRATVDFDGIKDTIAVSNDKHSQYHIRDKSSSLCRFLCVGPPCQRIEQMVALMEAGVLKVLNPDSKVTRNESDGSGWTVTDQDGKSNPVKVTAVVEARIQTPSVTQTKDSLLKDLLTTKQCRPYRRIGGSDTGALAISPLPERVIGDYGKPNERLFAIDVPTEGVRWVTTAVPRPLADSVLLRSTDAVARAAMRQAQKDLLDKKLG